MAGQILSLFAKPRKRDWSQQELAEFYRVESALIRSGLNVETDRGLTDEGEPWFVFCRSSDGEVVVHFAKCDGQYIVAGPAYERVAKGFDFSLLVRDLMSQHPLVNTKAREGSNVVLHPTALLVAVVAAALLKDGEAQAKGHEAEGHGRHRDAAASEAGGSWFPNINFTSSIAIDARHLAVVMSAVAVTLPVIETESLLPSRTGSLLVADFSTVEHEQIESDANSHGLIPADSNAVRAANLNEPPEALDGTPHAIISPDQKLELLSLTSILLDLSTTETKSEDVVAFNLGSGDEVGQEPSLAHQPGNSEVFLIIELAKGSGELPSVQAVLHLNGDATVPISLAQLQPFLDHALHLQGGAQSAVEVLRELTIHKTIDQSVLDSLQNSLSSTATELDNSIAVHDVGSKPISSPVIEQSPDVNDFQLPPAGDAVDSRSIVNAINRFVQDHGSFKVMLSGDDVIFCYAQALSASENTVQSVTWDFPDGSSITLIGPSSHLPMELIA